MSIVSANYKTRKTTYLVENCVFKSFVDIGSPKVSYWILCPLLLQVFQFLWECSYEDLRERL